MTDIATPQPRINAAPEVISEAEARFERGRKITGAIVAPLAFLLVAGLTASLGYRAQMLAAVLAAVAILWMTEALALPVTALLGPTLCIVLGVADARTVLAPFADPVVFLFIGSFMLARAMTVHGLDRRIALGILSWRWLAAHPARMLAGLGLVTAFISMWLSNTASTAMMVPIAVGMMRALQGVPRAAAPAGEASTGTPPLYATGLLLMTSFAASIGGLATPVGTPPNLIGIGFIRQLIGLEISFFGWMTLAVPIVAAMAVALFLLLWALYPPAPDTRQGEDLVNHLHQQRQQLGTWTAGQVNALLTLGVAFVLWILPGLLAILLPGQPAVVRAVNDHLPESVVALVAALLLFLLPIDVRRGEFTLTWADAVRIDWGTILLFGGGLSLGSLMFSTGVARALGEGVIFLTGTSSLWGLTGVSIVLAIVLSEATSNTAAASMIIPVVISLAQAANVNPLPPALGACLGATFGFMLPVSTPPNAIVYGTGLVPIARMMRTGILFDVLGFGIIWAGLRILCPLLGLG